MKRHRKVLAALGWWDPRILLGIGHFAREASWHLDTRAMFEPTAFTGWKGDGLLVSHTNDEHRARFFRRQAPQQPTVILHGSSTGFVAPVVREDDRAAGQQAALYFLKRGHRNLAWCSTLAGVVDRERHDGFREVAERADTMFESLYWPAERGARRDTWENRQRWLRRRITGLPKPVALLALDDSLAGDVIEVCQQAGMRVPEDVAVMGIGNLELACECSPVPISSVEFDFERVGYTAAELLGRLMDGQNAPAAPILIPPTRIIRRKSTDIVVVTHPHMKTALQFLADNLQRNFGLEELAQAVGISRMTLHHLFVHELHQSPAKYLLHIRLERAKKLLEESDENIGEIARVCGLLPLRTINRAFHRETGLSPRAYRQQHPPK